MSKKVLIIGGCGFIGHNLAIFLKKKNFDVTILDSLSVNNYYSFKKQNSGNKKYYLTILKQRQKLLKKNKIKLIISDARNYSVISKKIDLIKPDYLVHLAAVAHANVSNKDPFSTFDHSMRTLENTLDACRSKKYLKRFIYLSSSMVYGNFKKKTVTEDDLCNPLGIYASLKFGCEKLVIGYNQVFNLPYTIIRPSALYGERCVSGRVIQKFIESALKNEPLEMVGDGKEFLDFTYIDDLIKGIYLSMIKTGSLNNIFNLTYGKSRSLLDLVNIIKKNIKNVKIKYIKRDKLVPFRGTLSVNKAKKLLGYKPTYNIEKGVPKLIKWYENSKF
jgi:nucleoside-diphosphate-sugar epimerase